MKDEFREPDNSSTFPRPTYNAVRSGRTAYSINGGSACPEATCLFVGSATDDLTSQDGFPALAVSGAYRIDRLSHAAAWPLYRLYRYLPKYGGMAITCVYPIDGTDLSNADLDRLCRLE